MNTNPVQNLQYVMPEDEDEDDFDDDAADEMVDIVAEEAQRENDQLQANKVGNTALMLADENDADENAQPIQEKGHGYQPQMMHQAPIMTNQLQTGVKPMNVASQYESAQLQANNLAAGAFQAKQIQNQLGAGRIRPQSAKTVQDHQFLASQQQQQMQINLMNQHLQQSQMINQPWLSPQQYDMMQQQQLMMGQGQLF